MNQQSIIEDSGLSPSFSWYSSDSLTSMAAAKAIREEQASRFHETVDIDGKEFEFSLVLSDEEDSLKEIDTRGWTVFPVFNRDLQLNDEIKAKDNENDASSAITGTLGKLFLNERENSSSSSSCSSSEADELESLPSGSYCVWRPKADGSGSSSPVMRKCKKSSSTGSGSKRWRFRYLLRRSNSEGKEAMVVLNPKKMDSPKQKRNSGEVSKVAGRWKAETPIHEQFYVVRRAENEMGKRKSYLPYSKDLVGLFANVNGMGKMLPF